MVGRDIDMATAVAAAGSPGGVVFIEGTLGVGVSRFLEEPQHDSSVPEPRCSPGAESLVPVFRSG